MNNECVSFHLISSRVILNYCCLFISFGCLRHFTANAEHVIGHECVLRAFWSKQFKPICDVVTFVRLQEIIDNGWNKQNCIGFFRRTYHLPRNYLIFNSQKCFVVCEFRVSEFPQNPESAGRTPYCIYLSPGNLITFIEKRMRSSLHCELECELNDRKRIHSFALPSSNTKHFRPTSIGRRSRICWFRSENFTHLFLSRCQCSIPNK